MRHWKEWEKKRTFKCDNWDTKLVRLILDIQMHSQRRFFGKYAEMYFDNGQRRRQDAQWGSHNSKTKDVYRQLPEEFMLEDVISAGKYDSRKKAQACIHILIKKDQIKKISNPLN